MKPALVVFLGLVLYVIASNVGAGWLYVIVAVLVGMVLVSVPLPWLAVRGIGVARRAPVVATAGEPFECSLQIENTGRLPRYMLEVEDRFAGDTGRVVAVRVRRGAAEIVPGSAHDGLDLGGVLFGEGGAGIGDRGPMCRQEAPARLREPSAEIARSLRPESARGREDRAYEADHTGLAGARGETPRDRWGWGHASSAG